MTAPELGSRLIIERLTAGELDPTLARLVWEATAGIAPHTIKDDETFDVADRLGLVQGWYGRIRVSQPVEFSLLPGDPPALHWSSLLTTFLRIH